MKESLGPGVLGFPTPILMVGSYDKEENPNVMNAAAGGILLSFASLYLCGFA